MLHLAGVALANQQSTLELPGWFGGTRSPRLSGATTNLGWATRTFRQT